MVNQDNDIEVSICCTVFNHEKYLRKCLDGFVMQKTNFKFEALIHDDASTDSSVEIIREYERKYPDIIKPIYQKENQYSQGVKISWEFQYPRAKGKYIAMCEGDDYWCDENKLQMQYDEMEANPEAVFCVHDVRCISEEGLKTSDKYPRYSIKEQLIKPDQMMDIMVKHNSYPFQTSSYFYKAEYIKNIVKNPPRFMRAAAVGDVPLMLYYLVKGKFLYIDREMSCYRVLSKGSWSSRNIDSQKRINQMKIGMASYILFDVFSEGRYSRQVEKLVQLQEYHIYQIECKYKEICNYRYRWIFKQENLKQQIFYLLCAYFPFFSYLYKKIRRSGC